MSEEEKRETNGTWITVNGGHVFIRENETLKEALARYNVPDCKSESEGNDFKNSLINAKKTQAPEDAWRVDTDSHEGKDYIGNKIYTSKGGSTVAVTKDGDIVSVCTNKTDNMYGYELLEVAVRAGGKKLDSFDGNFGFYMRNGFEPVSWTAFDKKYAPNGWKEGRDREEPVVFFKYTGKKYGKQSKDFWELKKEKFYKKVKMSKDYDEAMKKRDKEV